MRNRVRTIFKYPLRVGVNEIRLPNNSHILDVQVQRNEIQMWVEQPVSNGQGEEPELRTRVFMVYGTGRLIPDNPGTYLGTVQQLSGALVWHIYEEGRRLQ